MVVTKPTGFQGERDRESFGPSMEEWGVWSDLGIEEKSVA